jgi:hypothetical protein
MSTIHSCKTGKGGVSYKAWFGGSGKLVIEMRQKYDDQKPVVMAHATKVFDYHEKMLVHFVE